MVTSNTVSTRVGSGARPPASCRAFFSAGVSSFATITWYRTRFPSGDNMPNRPISSLPDTTLLSVPSRFIRWTLADGRSSFFSILVVTKTLPSRDQSVMTWPAGSFSAVFSFVFTLMRTLVASEI